MYWLKWRLTKYAPGALYRVGGRRQQTVRVEKLKIMSMSQMRAGLVGIVAGTERSYSYISFLSLCVDISQSQRNANLKGCVGCRWNVHKRRKIREKWFRFRCKFLQVAQLVRLFTAHTLPRLQIFVCQWQLLRSFLLLFDRFLKKLS